MYSEWRRLKICEMQYVENTNRCGTVVESSAIKSIGGVPYVAWNFALVGGRTHLLAVRVVSLRIHRIATPGSGGLRNIWDSSCSDCCV